MSVHDQMRKRLLEQAGVDNKQWGHSKGVSLESMRRSEWSFQFEEFMRARLMMGRFRYGFMKDPAKGRFDNIGEAIKRLKRYQQVGDGGDSDNRGDGVNIDGGNQELLVDVANLCMIEFVHPNHPSPHFTSTDDGEHAKPL